MAKKISGRDLLNLYYSITPDERGSDRVERILGEIGCWELKQINLDQIRFSQNSVNNPKSKKNVKKIKRLKTEMPPIILDVFQDEYEIVDGFHRIAAAKEKGDIAIMAYIPVNSEIESF